ncbi:MAG: hypothetical protein M1482_14360 [Chloroflexi bacterium]|nr:hypothetical protein [Chloroflexota bacterium]
MKWISYAVSVVLVLGGGVFFLQGMRVLPSQVMYGKPEWVVIGALMVVAGVAVGTYTWRRGARGRNP